MSLINGSAINTCPVNGQCDSSLQELLIDSFSISDAIIQNWPENSEEAIAVGFEQINNEIERLADTLNITVDEEIFRLVINLVQDTITASDDLELFKWLPINETISLTDALQHTLIQFQEIEETLSVSDIISIVFEWLGQENLTLTPEISSTVAIAIISSLEISGAVEHQNMAVNVLAVALVMQDVVETGFFVELSDLVQLTSDYAAQLQAVYEQNENIEVSENIVQLVVTSQELIEAIEANDDLEIQQVLQNCIEEGISIEATIALGDAVYAAWTLHPETQGVTRYTDFNFNSLAWPYGARGDGIYLIEGVSPTASIKTGLMDFGSQKRKRIPEMFLGVTKADEIVLKVTTTDNDRRFEHWYKLKHDSPTDDITRIKMGRGLKSVYWQFELVSEEFMDLDNIELIPFEMSRRI